VSSEVQIESSSVVPALDRATTFKKVENLAGKRWFGHALFKKLG